MKKRESGGCAVREIGREIGGRIGEVWEAEKGKNDRMEEGEKWEKIKDRRKMERERMGIWEDERI